MIITLNAKSLFLAGDRITVFPAQQVIKRHTDGSPMWRFLFPSTTFRKNYHASEPLASARFLESAQRKRPSAFQIGGSFGEMTFDYPIVGNARFLPFCCSPTGF